MDEGLKKIKNALRTDEGAKLSANKIRTTNKTTQRTRLWHRRVASPYSRSFFLRWISADPSPWGKFSPPVKQECGETLGDLEAVYYLFTIASEIILSQTVTHVGYARKSTVRRKEPYEMLKRAKPLRRRARPEEEDFKQDWKINTQNR